jgi:pyridoxal phosphate enzyme (YggS family)
MSIGDALGAVRASIRASAAGAGRNPAEVRLLAVSKGHPAEAVREAYAAGHRDFGENYVQELVGKARALDDLTDLRWHFIGHLQRNKARDVARLATTIHTVDRVELARELDRRAEAPIDVLVEVNVAAEPQKSGCLPGATRTLLDELRAIEKLRVVGLMAIPPATDDPEAAGPHFAALRRLAEQARAAGHTDVRELSMGMSYDFDVAVREGSTWVRVGTAIFGARAPRAPASETSG